MNANRLEVAHRPWSMPERPWTVAMTWHNLLFAHWPVPAASLRSLIPENLEIDTFNSTAWIGVVPFEMSGVCPKMFPSFLAARFPELNVRTYVKLNGKPGVWFFSLDATHRPFYFAQRFYFLPYQRAEMSVAKNERMRLSIGVTGLFLIRDFKRLSLLNTNQRAQLLFLTRVQSNIG